MRMLFTGGVFLGSFLLFLVEPMVAKVILPEFGGSAAVWTASLLFFQLALLAGYAFAHVLGRFRAQVGLLIYAAIAVLGVLLLITPPWLPNPAAQGLPHFSGPVTIQVLFLLIRMIGLPFFLLAAGAPLLQRAFARSRDTQSASPYFLYAASNLGSLLGLFAYPLALEPLMKLRDQRLIWALAFIPVVILVAVCLSLGRGADADAEEEAAAPPPLRQRLLWVGLAAAPSSLLLGLTTYLTTNLAPVPLLWIIPLAAYLITFIIAFARKPRVTAAGVGRWVPLLAAPLALALVLESTEPIVPLALFHLATFFVVALACHLRLSESRPVNRHLTDFYLMIAIGGVLGGAFNAIVAPALFTTLFEYPLALGVGAALVAGRVMKPFERRDLAWPLVVVLVNVGLIVAVRLIGMPPSPVRTLAAIGIPAILCFIASDNPIRFGLSLTCVFAVAALSQIGADGSVIFSARSFYGVHRVIEDSKLHLRKLVHGNTTHGIQSLDPSRRGEPLTYYARTGPAGDIFTAFHPHHTALIGLGVGSLAAYGTAQERMTYFEIDPIVDRIARDPKLFTFLQDSKAKVDVVEGDGRLSLATQPDHEFGIVLLDAFSSDSIPVHLLTEEAIRLYLTKLEPHGLIAFHVSNRYLDLSPILAAEARDLGLTARFRDDSTIPDEELAAGKTASKWLVMVREPADLGLLLRNPEWETPTAAANGWTDDYSNVLGAFRLKN